MSGHDRLYRHLVEDHYVRRELDPDWSWVADASTQELLDLHADDHEHDPHGWYPARLYNAKRRCSHRHSPEGLVAIHRAIFMDIASRDATRC